MNYMLDSLLVRFLCQIIFDLGVKYPFIKDQIQIGKKRGIIIKGRKGEQYSGWFQCFQPVAAGGHMI